MILTFQTNLDHYKPLIQFCLPNIDVDNMIPVPRKGEMIKIKKEGTIELPQSLEVIEVTHDYRCGIIRIELHFSQHQKEMMSLKQNINTNETK